MEILLISNESKQLAKKFKKHILHKYSWRDFFRKIFSSSFNPYNFDLIVLQAPLYSYEGFCFSADIDEAEGNPLENKAARIVQLLTRISAEGKKIIFLFSDSRLEIFSILKQNGEIKSFDQLDYSIDTYTQAIAKSLLNIDIQRLPINNKKFRVRLNYKDAFKIALKKGSTWDVCYKLNANNDNYREIITVTDVRKPICFQLNSVLVIPTELFQQVDVDKTFPYFFERLEIRKVPSNYEINGVPLFKSATITKKVLDMIIENKGLSNDEYIDKINDSGRKIYAHTGDINSWAKDITKTEHDLLILLDNKYVINPDFTIIR